MSKHVTVLNQFKVTHTVISSFLTICFIKCVAIIAKSARELYHVFLPSVCPHVFSAFHTVWICVVFDCGNVCENLLIIQIWIKLGIIIEYFTCRPKYIFLLPATLIRPKGALIKGLSSMKCYQSVRIAQELQTLSELPTILRSTYNA